MVIKCPKCNHYVSDTTAVCPHCGVALKEDAPVLAREPVSASQEEKSKVLEEEIIQQVNPPVEKPMEEPEVDNLANLGPTKEEFPVAEQIPASVAPPPSSAPVAPLPVANHQAKNNTTTVVSVIVVLLLLCGIGGFWYFKNVSNTEELAKVENLYFESVLGTCSYTGTVDGDNLPHGTGEATFADGRFYRGSFVHGNFNGNNAYFLYDNGDVFEGTFVDNQFSEGKYTIKSDGSYFEGSFENGQPNQGLWFDKDGHNLIGQ